MLYDIWELNICCTSFGRVLKEWLRVTSTGGIIAFTHKVRGVPLSKQWLLVSYFCERYQDHGSSHSKFVEMVMLVIIIHTFQSLVLDAWEKEQKKLEEQGLWKLIYRLNQDQSFESTGLVQCTTQLVKKCWVQIFGHILILVIDRSPPLYYLPSLMVPSQERVFVFCYKKLWSAHGLPIGWTYLTSPANYIENETKRDHDHCSALN